MIIKKNSRSGIFLIEIILAILFFALASSVCLSFFAESRQLSADAADLNNAVAASITVSEAFQGSDTPEAAAGAVKMSFDNAEVSASHGEINLDEDGLILVYDVSPSSQVAGITCIAISVKKDDEVVYDLIREVYYEEKF